jgi:hypothetical protein
VGRWNSDDCDDLHLFDPEHVELALSAMHSQPRTALMGHGFINAAGEGYLHRVAFDIGKTALEGDIVYRDCDWVFSEVSSDL